MKVSELWLREWVNPGLTGTQLAAQLTMAGLEVDAYYPVAGTFSQVLVGCVLETEPHPQADKLTICQVKADLDTPYTIVCGAHNVRPGLKVALAIPGARLPGDVKIKKAKLRGQVSQGMLCSAKELGLEEKSEGILELPDDAPVGDDSRAYMQLDDFVIDIDLTPNRGDCFSMLGIAREVAAINQLSLNTEDSHSVESEIEESITVQLKAPSACPRYAGRVVKGISPSAVTPLWLKERLRRGGIRPCHPVVDVTNYVMLELGQPMHAFDLKTIVGGIQVRFAEPNELLTLLDGQSASLNESVLVIADEAKPLALAGIMGGEESSVTENTQDVFLESAFFNPLSITGVARHFGLSSDSSQRFERGVDPTLQKRALERATELLIQIAGGKPGPIMMQQASDELPKAKPIHFQPDMVSARCGVVIDPSQMLAILRALNMDVNDAQRPWQVQAPAYRFDIEQEVDLVEEILRLYGYDNLTSQPMLAVAKKSSPNIYESTMAVISRFLCHRGYREVINYSFVDPEVQKAFHPEQNSLQLINPLSQELSQMRLSLWPGLMASLIYNVHRQQHGLQLFETGVAFQIDGNKLQERHLVAGLISGERGRLNWSEQAHQFDFYDLKGDLQALFHALNLSDVRFQAATHPALHPGKTASIVHKERVIGVIGELHPRLLDAMDLNDDVILFELNLDELLPKPNQSYQPVSKYPQIRRDLSFLVDEDVCAEEIERTIRSLVREDWLRGYHVFDVYQGDSVPSGKKSIAVAMILQDDTRTLIDSEINVLIDAIIKKLEEQFSIILRD